MKKRIWTVSLIFVLLVAIPVAAVAVPDEGPVAPAISWLLADAQSVQAGDTVALTFSLAQAPQGTPGINAVSGVLEYDHNAFALASGPEAQGKWVLPSCVDSTGTFAGYRTEGGAQDSEPVWTAVFQAQSSAQAGKKEFRLSLSYSDGAQTYRLENEAVTVSVLAPATPEPTPQEPSATPDVTSSPDPTAGPSATPDVTSSPDPTAGPSSTPDVTSSPDPTTGPSATPDATSSPDPTAEPTVNPTSTPTAAPTAGSEPSPTPPSGSHPSAAPSPTASPSAGPVLPGNPQPSEEPPAPAHPILKLDHTGPYLHGYPDHTLRPEAGITREEAAVLLFGLADQLREQPADSFHDVAGGGWSAEAIAGLSGSGVLQGYPDGNFRPGAFITRAEFVSVLVRFFDPDGRQADGFPDLRGHWAEMQLRWAAAQGWIKGLPDGSFAPERAVTRAEACAILNRVLKRELPSQVPPASQWADLKMDQWYTADLLAAAGT